MSEWKSIQTVPIGVDVLVFCADGAMTLVIANHDRQGNLRFWHVPVSHNSEETNEPSHWMPLPEPPRAPQASAAG